VRTSSPPPTGRVAGHSNADLQLALADIDRGNPFDERVLLVHLIHHNHPHRSVPRTWLLAGADEDTENLTLVLDGNNAGPLKRLPASDSNTGSRHQGGPTSASNHTPIFSPAGRPYQGHRRLKRPYRRVPHPNVGAPPSHRAAVAVEGLRFAGKTTLVTAVAERLGAVAVPEYAELATLPPWPPHTHDDVAAALRHFLRVEQQRAARASRAPGGLVVLDRSPLTVIAHEFGMDRLGIPAAPGWAARLFAEAAGRGLILTPDAYVHL
jgi:hypothetical protein